ncbi:MAG: twin-arginine translocase TatA/TatE family subunit [Parasphingorhabdus sp.]|nr:twin-arginine translocase TatA/TatE family subunit [Parasphingorhabdus sp.]
MGSFSIWHWLVVAALVLLLFGRGRISEVMGDFGKGINSFKKGLSETEEKMAPPQIDAKPAEKTVEAENIKDGSAH